jgi:hypothetical protein
LEAGEADFARYQLLVSKDQNKLLANKNRTRILHHLYTKKQSFAEVFYIITFLFFSVPTVNDLFRKRPNELEPQIKRESPIKLAKYDVEDDEDQLSEEFPAKHYSSKHNI